MRRHSHPQQNLVLHQMDVKMAYLHAPIECEIFIEQLQGYDKESETGEKMVCKLQKSIFIWS